MNKIYWKRTLVLLLLLSITLSISVFAATKSPEGSTAKSISLASGTTCNSITRCKQIHQAWLQVYDSLGYSRLVFNPSLGKWVSFESVYLPQLEDAPSSTEITNEAESSEAVNLNEISGRYAVFINAAAGHFGIQPALIAVFIKYESGGNLKPSPTGCQGLMQVCNWNANYNGFTSENPNIKIKDDALDPEANIYVGTYILSQKFKSVSGCKEGSDRIKCVIAAYNAGEGLINYATKGFEGEATWQQVITILQNEEFVKGLKAYSDERFWINSNGVNQTWTDSVSCQGFKDKVTRRGCKMYNLQFYVNKIFASVYGASQEQTSSSDETIATASGVGKKVLLIGDSHTAGYYGELLHNSLVNVNYEVRTYGCGGKVATAFANNREVSCSLSYKWIGNEKTLLTKLTPNFFQTEINSFNPDIVVISLGTNYWLRESSIANPGSVHYASVNSLLDSALGKTCYWVGAPVSTIKFGDSKLNYDGTCTKNHPNDYETSCSLVNIPGINRGDIYDYNLVNTNLRKLVEDKGCNFIDPTQIAGLTEDKLRDKLHFNNDGYTIWANYVFKKIIK
ncbi:MAG: transglycosylase SLT domain-containing protein [archaeon]|nr:transglycosylase SLT domain-containing protein [archaeon]